MKLVLWGDALKTMSKAVFQGYICICGWKYEVMVKYTVCLNKFKKQEPSVGLEKLIKEEM